MSGSGGDNPNENVDWGPFNGMFGAAQAPTTRREYWRGHLNRGRQGLETELGADATGTPGYGQKRTWAVDANGVGSWRPRKPTSTVRIAGEKK